MNRFYFSTVFGLCLLVILLFLKNYINYLQTLSFAYGLILNLINTFLAFYFFKKSIKTKNKQFLQLVFGGMVLRLFLILAMLVLIIISLKIDIYAFIFTFLIIYFISLSWEISIYLKETKKIR